LLIGLGGCGSKGPVETWWLGHLTPLGGKNQEVGDQERHALEIAVEDANANDQRIAGRRVGVLHVDSRADAEHAQAEAVRLVTINKILGLIADNGVPLDERLGLATQPYQLPVVTP